MDPAQFASHTSCMNCQEQARLESLNQPSHIELLWLGMALLEAFGR